MVASARRDSAPLLARLFVPVGACCIIAAAALMAWGWRQSRQADAALASAQSELAQHIRQSRAKGATGEWQWTSGQSGLTYLAMLEVMGRGVSVPVLVEIDMEQLALMPCRWAGSVAGGSVTLCVYEDAPCARQLMTIPEGAELQLTVPSGETTLYGVTELRDVSSLDEVGTGAYDLILVECDEDLAPQRELRCTAVH